LRYVYPAYVRNNRLRASDMRRMRAEAYSFALQPLISVVLPVYNPERRWLEEAMDSVLSQIYPRWELCICDDSSTEEHVREVLSCYERLDDRIKIKRLDKNVGISASSNAALSLAKGEFVVLLDHDDELAPDALFEVVRHLQDHPDTDLIYTDEDKKDEAGNRRGPHFKPDWSPDLLLSHNYIGHLCVFRRMLLEEVGGFREGFEGSQDYDLLLRFTERTQRIHHIPKILYHWKVVEGSVTTGSESKPYTQERSRKAISEALERRGLKGSVEDGFAPNLFRVELQVENKPKVSIVIPTRDNLTLLKSCVESIERLTTYPNYEILIVDNDSTDPKTVQYLASTPHRVLEFREPFNHSRINNAGVSKAEGEYVLLLNDDTEVISGEWIETMLGFAQRPDVGAVGGKLLFPDGRIQHAGVPTGVGTPWGPSVATHSHHLFPNSSRGYAEALQSIRNYNAVTAACMMTRRTVFDEVGSFDEENLPTTFNDVDLCMRIRKRGYLIVYNPHAQLYHHETASRERRIDPAAVKYMRERWGEALDSDPYYNPNFSRGHGDFNIRADLLRPKMLRTEEPRERFNMSMEERQAYIITQQRNARSSRRTTLMPLSSEATSVTEQNEQNAVGSRGSGTRLLGGEVGLDTFFILGSSRSGTTWLQNILGSHPEIVCKGEGMFFGRSTKLHEGARSLYAALERSEDLKIWHDMRIWTEGEFEDFVPNLVRLIADSLFREGLEEKPGAKIVGDKTPHYAFNLDEVHSVYPESKIIHIIRDGRDVAISNVYNLWRNAKDRGGPLQVNPRVLDKRDRFLANPKAFLATGESVFPQAVLRNLAKRWIDSVTKGAEDGPELFGKRYIEVKYENLLEQPYVELPRLLSFLEVDDARAVIERTVEENSFEQLSGGRQRGTEDSNSFFRKGMAGDWKHYFTKDDKQVFKQEAGELLIRLGYEKDLSW
jgi:O-antigen biosynthesis protein